MKPWIRTGCVLFVVFATVPLTARPAANGAAPASQQARSAPDGVQEGVSLHGSWVLDVHDPDGTFVRHVEFKNALTIPGQAALADFLTGQAIWDWVVTFNEGHITSPNEVLTPLCERVGRCAVSRPNRHYALAGWGSAIGVFVFPSLAIFPDSGRLVMGGQFTVTAAGASQIERVATHLIVGPQTDRVFTMATLPTPLPVAQGQIVQFTYTLSFS